MLLKKHETPDVTKALIEAFTQFSYLMEILCDNGPELRSKLDNIYFEAFEIKHKNVMLTFSFKLQYRLLSSWMKNAFDQSLIRSQIQGPRQYHGYCMHIVRYL